MGLKRKERAGRLFNGAETSGVLIPAWKRAAGAGLGKKVGRRGEDPPGKGVGNPV